MYDKDGVKLKQTVKLYLTSDEKEWVRNNVEKSGDGCLYTTKEAKRLLNLGHKLRKVKAMYTFAMTHQIEFHIAHPFKIQIWSLTGFPRAILKTPNLPRGVYIYGIALDFQDAPRGRRYLTMLRICFGFYLKMLW